jgi:aryl-alcohol dehydrogenase-like predicted oxidoreductase
MALAPWGVLAGGKIRSDAEEKKRLESGAFGRGDSESWKRTPDEKKISDALEKVAAEVGAKSLNAGTYCSDSNHGGQYTQRA